MTTYDVKDGEQKVETTIDKAQDMAGRMGEEAKQKASDATTMAKDQAKRVATQVGEQAKSTVETRKGEVAQELNSVADVVRQTTYEVGAGSNPTIEGYGRRIADQIEGISSYVDEHGVEDILADAQDFGRRQPAVFLGGAFMLGLVVGRFLRSSGSRAYNSEMSEAGRYQTDYTGSGLSRSGNSGSSYTGSGSGQSGNTGSTSRTQYQATSSGTASKG